MKNKISEGEEKQYVSASTGRVCVVIVLMIVGV